MPRRKPLPFTECWRDRHGRVRVYFRRGKGPRVPLPSDIGSAEFMRAYQAALAGEVIEDRPARRLAATPGTIGALVLSYLRSDAYRDLRATTKPAYRPVLEMLRTEHGHRRLDQMTRKGVEERILNPYADRPGTKTAVLRVLRALVRHGLDADDDSDIKLRTDPIAGIKRPKLGEIRSWTDAEIAQFEARWPIGTKQRLAFALHLYTGQRRSDVHRMKWGDIVGDRIGVVQQKTAVELKIRIHAELRPILDAAKQDMSCGSITVLNPDRLTILRTEYGKPFTVDGFSGFMRDAIRAAGLPLGCQPHGLRKAAGRRLAEAECTPHEIMAVLGHKSLAEAERYTREADKTRLAASAIEKQEKAQKANRVAQTGRAGLGTTPKKRGKTR